MTQPQATYTHSPRLTSTNPVDDFFGSVSSRHDRRISVDVLPAYVEPPAYTWRDTEPITLAMYLFKFGLRMSYLESSGTINQSFRSLSSFLDPGRNIPDLASATAAVR